EYYDMAERRANWMMDVTLYVYQTYRPDLIFTRQELIAQCARPFLLVDERQKEYGTEKTALYTPYLQKAHASADSSLKRLLAFVNLSDSAVFVLSAYGMMPVHTTVYLNTVLRNAKLLQIKTGAAGDEVDKINSKAWAWASGGSAHIYMNLQGRELFGAVAPEDYEKVREQIVQALGEVRYDKGQPVFSRIVKQQELSNLQLEAALSGDVFVQAMPGYCLSDELNKKVLLPSLHYADTGFDATFNEMHGIFIAAGNGLARGKGIPPVHLLDIAPTIAKALGFQPPPTMVGHVVENIWQ
ncbi:MAG: alkaline phosphatase family protein, partial [Candidatus Hadarchaeum sp.]